MESVSNTFMSFWHSIKKILEERNLTPILTLLEKCEPASYAHRVLKHFSHKSSLDKKKYNVYSFMNQCHCRDAF